MAASQETIRPPFFIQSNKGPAVYHQIAKLIVFVLGSVTPMDLVGLAQGNNLFNP
jgi:hypothetical protein